MLVEQTEEGTWQQLGDFIRQVMAIKVNSAENSAAGGSNCITAGCVGLKH